MGMLNSYSINFADFKHVHKSNLCDADLTLKTFYMLITRSHFGWVTDVYDQCYLVEEGIKSKHHSHQRMETPKSPGGLRWPILSHPPYPSLSGLYHAWNDQERHMLFFCFWIIIMLHFMYSTYNRIFCICDLIEHNTFCHFFLQPEGRVMTIINIYQVIQFHEPYST